jgi:hypothetical protein
MTGFQQMTMCSQGDSLVGCWQWTDRPTRQFIQRKIPGAVKNVAVRESVDI